MTGRSRSIPTNAPEIRPCQKLQPHAWRACPAGASGPFSWARASRSLDVVLPAGDESPVSSGRGKTDRPYLAAWLRRTRRQFAVSGRLSQIALVLSRQEGGSLESWRERLAGILDERETPDFELLTKIDRLLAGPARPDASGGEQDSFW